MPKCPNDPEGVHRLGVNTVCACGYKLEIPRFHFSLEIYDNEISGELASESFGCSHIETIADKLRAIAAQIERR